MMAGSETADPGRRRARWPGFLLAAALAWIVLVRLPLVLNAETHLDSDLAVDGLTLLHATQGQWRWHYPGTPRMGILPVLLSWPQAMLWGANPWTLVSGGVVAYLQRANLPLLRTNDSGLKRPWVGWAAIGALVVLTPLGLLATGEAFGEDAPESARVWTTIPFDGYGFDGPAWLAYVVCAVIGVAVVGATVFLIGKVRTRR